MTTFNALIAAIAFFLIPVGMGRLTRYLFSQITPIKWRHSKTDDAVSTFLGKDFPLGALVLYSVIFITKLASGTNGQGANFSATFTFFSYTALILSLGYIAAKVLIALGKHTHTYVTKIPHNETATPKTLLRKTLAFMYCLLLALISQFVWKWKSGLNNSLDWDTFFHQTIANIILEGNFSLILSTLSDSVKVNAYTSIFHALIAIPQAVFSPDILAFWWFAGFFQLLLVVITSFNIGSAIYKYIRTFAKHVESDTQEIINSKSYFVGSLVALFGAFSFLSYLAFNPYFLIPQILASTIATNGLIILLYNLKNKTSKVVAAVELLPCLVFVILNHYVLGTYCALLIVGIFIAHILSERFIKVNFSSILKYLSLLVLVLVPFILRYFDLEDINPNESGYYALSLKEKYEQLTVFYGYLWIGLLLLGVSYLIKQAGIAANVLFSAFVLIVASLIAPIPYNLKFMAFSVYIVHTLMALGLYWLSDLKHGFKGNGKAILLYCAVFVALLFNLLNNVITYKQTPSYKNVFTHVSENESKATEYIKEHYKGTPAGDVMILSDPATMFIFEALTGINSPGGAYAEENVRKTLANVYFSRDSSTLANGILSIKDGIHGEAQTYLLVISRRYFEWLQSGDAQIYAYYFNIWQPIDLKVGDYDYIRFLKDTNGLEMVYENEGVVVVEVKR